MDLLQKQIEKEVALGEAEAAVQENLLMLEKVFNMTCRHIQDYELAEKNKKWFKGAMEIYTKQCKLMGVHEYLTEEIFKQQVKNAGIDTTKPGSKRKWWKW